MPRVILPASEGGEMSDFVETIRRRLGAAVQVRWVDCLVIAALQRIIRLAETCLASQADHSLINDLSDCVVHGPVCDFRPIKVSNSEVTSSASVRSNDQVSRRGHRIIVNFALSFSMTQSNDGVIIFVNNPRAISVVYKVVLKRPLSLRRLL